MNIILYGNDASRMKQNLDVLKKKYQISEVVEFDVNKNKMEEVLFEIDSVSIFDEHKMIVLYHCSFLSAKDESDYDVNEFMQRSNEDNPCIVVFCCENNKFDKRKNSIKKFLSTISSNNIIPCLALDEKNKKSYIQDYCKRIGLTMDYDAFEWFCSRVGMDSMKIENELDKCALYSSHLQIEDVQALLSVEPLQNIFKMVDALKNKNALLLLSYYRNFRNQKIEPLAINALLASQMRFLFQVRVCMDTGMTKDEIVSKFKAHPYRIQVTMKQASTFHCDEILAILDQLSTLDQNHKMGKMDMDEGFEQFVFQMLTK
ncbi:DNA polymerase III subunit delta [Floccifex sp.]|uniref:DNA polymerase III subunit delta n=1 Tax=Floccifex sp. TaxID=2815810 RepID=UPI003EFEC537